MEILGKILLNIIGFGLQSFAIFFGIYLFNKQKINIQQYLLASVIMSILSALVRLLPISLGVHTIINMLITYLICVILLKLPAYSTIRSTSLCVVLILICEMIITTIAVVIYGGNGFDSIMNDSFQRSIIGILANILFSLIIVILFIILDCQQ